MDLSVSSNSAETLHDAVMGGTRPIIGITTYRQPASWGAWNDVEAALVPSDYVGMVADAGGTPILLPPVGNDVTVLDCVDGLIFSGGADIDPHRYGADPHPLTRPQPHRDAWEFPLLQQALTLQLPVLGICRGMQLINVALGGTLHQHLPEVVGHTNYQPAPGEYGTADVVTRESTLARQILGKSASVACYHHQSVDKVAPCLQVTAQASDGTIEVLEPGERFQGGWLLAVQWHPEHTRKDMRIVSGLVSAASRSERRAHALSVAGNERVVS